MEREFTYDGVQFHLNSNPWKNEYEGKYVLTYYNDARGWNMALATVDSKKEAMERVKQMKKDHVGPWL